MNRHSSGIDPDAPRSTPASRERYIEGHSRNLSDESSYLHSDHSLIIELVTEIKSRLDPGAKVLEVGCGGGHTAALMADLGFQVTGTDFSSVAIETAKANHPKVNFKTADATDLDFDDNYFDAVIAVELIEHLARPEEHVKEVSRVLRPGGFYFVKTPNRTLHDIYYRGNKNISDWHPSVMSAKELENRLKLFGFSVRFVRMRRLPAYQVRKLLSKLGAVGRIVKPIVKMLPIGWLAPRFQPSLIVVARSGQDKSEGRSQKSEGESGRDKPEGGSS